MPKLYYYQEKTYAEEHLLKKSGVQPDQLEGAYLLVLDTPKYDLVYEVPTKDFTYSLDEDSQTYRQHIVYVPRELEDARKRAQAFVKAGAQQATKECCADVDPVILSYSTAEQFTDIKQHLAVISTELHDKLEGVAAATTVDEIKLLVDTPFSTH